jgi:sterol desaturase/sphingolipid hydroxylase (fatty acid hydroxylase superfamily)
MKVPGGARLKRLGLEVLGWLLVVAGVAALILPGPGLLMIAAGLVVLSQEYEWAERRVEPVKRKALRGAAESVDTPLRIAVSSLVGLVIVGFGALWIWHPPAPSWWPVDESWWLFGGIGTGITLVASGLVALALVVYSYRRFRVRGEPAPG